MPSHYGGMKMKKGHQGGNGKLTDRQKKALSNHSKHHTKKHMDFMKEKMKSGKTFGEAHKMAMRKVGN